MPLYKLAYRFAGSVERAEDLCQEILVRAYLQLVKFDSSRPFQPWLMRMASNVCLNWKEGEVRRSSSESQLDEDFVMPGPDDVEQDVFDRLERHDLIEALAVLPNDIRLLVVMRFSLGLTFREISEQTGIKLPTVAARVSRGIDSLRAVLAPGAEVHE